MTRNRIQILQCLPSLHFTYCYLPKQDWIYKNNHIDLIKNNAQNVR